jgi:ketosteroid isomerase-like protein
MKIPTFLLPLVIMLSLQACNQSDNSLDLDEVTKLLTQYSAEWAEAIKNRDGASVEDYFSTEMIYQGPDGTIQTKDDLIRDMNENQYETKSFILEDVEVKLVGKEIAIVTGGGGRIWIDSSGEEQLYKSRFTNVWRMKSGKWQCIAGHGNPLIYGDNESDLIKIKAIPTKAADAINSGNIDAWLELFDDDAQIMFNGAKTLNGIEEIEKELKRYWEDPESNISIEHFETKLLGDFAYGIGTDLGTERNPDIGEIVTVNSREFVVFKKQSDGEWKVFRLMTNQNQ